LFVDRSVGKYHVPEALHLAGVEVRIHDDHFDPITPDEVWLAEAGQRGWVVLTKDDNIRRRQVAINAIIRNRVRTLVLPTGSLAGQEMAEIVVRALPRIRQLVIDFPPPFIAIVAHSGKVNRLNLRLSGGG
jgi:PIN like domain